MTIEGKKFSALTEQQKADTRDAIRGYKVYTATISPSYSFQQGPSTLTVGKKYIILSLNDGDNFENVGFIDTGMSFVATGTTPTTWTNGTIVLNLTDYVINISEFENTIGTVDVIYDEDNGSGFKVVCDNIDETSIIFTTCNITDRPYIIFAYFEDGEIFINITDLTNNVSFGNEFTLEIRKY